MCMCVFVSICASDTFSLTLYLLFICFVPFQCVSFVLSYFLLFLNGLFVFYCEGNRSKWEESKEKLEEVGRRKAIIRTYYMKTIFFQFKKNE